MWCFHNGWIGELSTTLDASRAMGLFDHSTRPTERLKQGQRYMSYDLNCMESRTGMRVGIIEQDAFERMRIPQEGC